MFTGIVTIIAAARKIAEFMRDRNIAADTASSVAKVLDAGEALWRDVQAGRAVIHDDDGTPLTIAEFNAKFAAWEQAQAKASQGASGRIDARHAADGTGQP